MSTSKDEGQINPTRSWQSDARNLSAARLFTPHSQPGPSRSTRRDYVTVWCLELLSFTNIQPSVSSVNTGLCISGPTLLEERLSTMSLTPAASRSDQLRARLRVFISHRLAKARWQGMFSQMGLEIRINGTSNYLDAPSLHETQLHQQLPGGEALRYNLEKNV